MKQSALVGAVLLIALAACGRAPDAELNSARAMLDAARPFSSFAPDAFGNADWAMQVALVELATQKQKTFPSYRRTRGLLADATEAAASAKRAGESAARTRAQTTVSRAENALVEAQRRWKSGDPGLITAPDDPSGRMSQFDKRVFAVLFRAMQGDGTPALFDQCASSVEEAKQALASGKVVHAIDVADFVLGRLESSYPGITKER